MTIQAQAMKVAVALAAHEAQLKRLETIFTVSPVVADVMATSRELHQVLRRAVDLHGAAIGLDVAALLAVSAK